MSLNLSTEFARDSWMGGIRHKFILQGQEAWIVEPPEPLEEKLYFHVPEWPDAFPERNGVKELLALGYYMIHIHVRNTFANEESLQRMKALYDFVQTLGFAPKGALIGIRIVGASKASRRRGLARAANLYRNRHPVGIIRDHSV